MKQTDEMKQLDRLDRLYRLSIWLFVIAVLMGGIFW